MQLAIQNFSCFSEWCWDSFSVLDHIKFCGRWLATDDIARVDK